MFLSILVSFLFYLLLDFHVHLFLLKLSLNKITDVLNSMTPPSLPPLPLPKTKTTTTTSVGRPKHVRVMAGSIEGDMFIGKKAQELKGLLKINYPIEHGIVNDWDDMERIWSYIYQSELETASEEVRCKM